jgi:methionine aminopeptidase
MDTTVPSPQQLVADYVALQDIQENRRVSALTHQLLAEVAAFLKPGLTESQLSQQIDAHFKQSDVIQYWHKPYVRFGRHTTLSYYDVVKHDDVTLQDTDIAYLDIGPVIDGIEGDAGQTYVIGHHAGYEAIQACCEQLYTKGLARWKTHNPSGIELYAYLAAEAKAAGYTFDLDPAGHMIGRFPHKGWKKGINHYPFPLDAGIWILEIHLLSACKTYGAFYENLLM